MGALTPISLREKVLDLGPIPWMGPWLLQSAMNLIRKSWRKEVPECLPQAQEKKRVSLQPVTAPFIHVLVLVLNRGLKSSHHGQESSFNSKLKFYRTG